MKNMAKAVYHGVWNHEKLRFLPIVQIDFDKWHSFFFKGIMYLPHDTHCSELHFQMIMVLYLPEAVFLWLKVEKLSDNVLQ